MPHFHIEYSANLEDAVDMAALCEAIRAQAALIDTFPMAGVRVRATRVDHFAMADGNPKHGFIDLSVRLREGRSQEVKEATTQTLFAVVTTHLAKLIENRPMLVSLEMREIDALLAPKINTIRLGGQGGT